MRTLRPLALLLLLAAPLQAQPTRPGGLTEREYQNKKRELRHEIERYMSEYAQFQPGYSGFRGMWKIDGTRTDLSDGSVTKFAGDLSIQIDDGEFEVKGRVSLDGYREGPWKGEGALSDDGSALETAFVCKRVAGDEGEAKYKIMPDGSLELTFEGRDNGADAYKGKATLVRSVTLDKAALEKKLFDLNMELQYLRYPRPRPISYKSRSRDVKLRFTPTVDFDPNGVEAEVVEMIGKAKKSIDLCVFEFALMRVSRALVAAQQRGVKVRMVYDTREDDQPAIKNLKANNVPLRGDNRTALMHNKFMIIDKGEADGNIVWTGSTNLAPGGIYVADNHAFTFRNEKLAGIYTTEFEEMFVDNQFGPRSPSNTSKDWIEIDRYTKLQVYFAPEDNAMDRLVQVVRTAKHRIRIMAFAFTSEALFKAIKERIADGVTVEALFESRHAGWADIKIGPLHALGAKVRFDRNPDAMHHKVMIIDDDTVISGSFNFSDSADTSNDENMLVIKSRPLVRTFSREFVRVMSVTDATDPRLATAGMPAGGSGIVGNLDDD